MSSQLVLDFSASASARHRRAVAAAKEADQFTLFAAAPIDIDIGLQSPQSAYAHVSTGDPSVAAAWLSRLVGGLHVSNPRRLLFDINRLDRLLWVRPPTKVTLDAAAAAYARALWAQTARLDPLRVRRHGSRLVASSPRGSWPAAIAVRDAPWPTIAAAFSNNVAVNVCDDASTLLSHRLTASNVTIATAGISGSTVLLAASAPHVVESWNLPALAYDGGKDTGRYKIPAAAAEPLLDNKMVHVPSNVAAAITAAVTSTKPWPSTRAGFPWTLYDFQAADCSRAAKILADNGGVLLAGDMGSGKTTMSLALIHANNALPLLVVAPLSGFSTWARQLDQMHVHTYFATESVSKSWAEIATRSYDAVVISYDRLPAFTELVETYGFAAVIADEIQRIRTPSSRRSRALRSIAASIPLRIGLSGTPLTNTVTDVLPLGAFLVPSQWPARASSRDLADVYPGDPVESLTAHLGTLMVRRRMEDVPATLPKRCDHRVKVQLTAAQNKALADLGAQTRKDAKAGQFTGPTGRMHAFSRLQLMRQIINCPRIAGIGGDNPKASEAIRLIEDFLAMGRKGVLFCADRAVFTDLGKMLTTRGIGWVGIWGSTSAAGRVDAENRFHSDPSIKVVLCTIQAGCESWSASPTATFLISVAYMYSPAALAQMEARVYRMNSDPDGPDIHVCYVHAQSPEPTLDDRMLEILDVKRQLFAQVVDRRQHIDPAVTHLSMQDLMYLLTGTHDDTCHQHTTAPQTSTPTTFSTASPTVTVRTSIPETTYGKPLTRSRWHNTTRNHA